MFDIFLWSFWVRLGGAHVDDLGMLSGPMLAVLADLLGLRVDELTRGRSGSQEAAEDECTSQLTRPDLSRFRHHFC